MTPWTITSTRLFCPWDSPGKNTEVEYFLLQGSFPTQGLDLCLWHWQADSSPLSHQGSLVQRQLFRQLKCTYLKRLKKKFCSWQRQRRQIKIKRRRGKERGRRGREEGQKEENKEGGCREEEEDEGHDRKDSWSGSNSRLIPDKDKSASLWE